MTDVVFVAVLIAFFGIAVAFVRACEHIVGPDRESAARVQETDSDRAAA